MCIAEVFDLIPIRSFDGWLIYKARLKEKYGPTAQNYIEGREHEIKPKLQAIERVLLLTLKLLAIFLLVILCLYSFYSFFTYK